MIKFHKIRWKNFLSTGNDYISLDLSKDTKTLIIGENGHGKSQFLDAVCYALYNKAFRKINLPQLVNSINRKQLLVDIAFSIGKHSYVVRRGQKPKLFEIYRDGKLIPEDSATGDYQKYLENTILQMSYKSFIQVTIIGKASFTPFMSLKPDERRTVVEDVLDSQVYGVMLQLAKNDLKEESKAYRDIATEIEKSDAFISAQRKLIERRSQDKVNIINNLKQSFKDISEKCAEGDKIIESLEQKLQIKTQEYKEFVKDPQKVFEMKTSLASEKAFLQSSINQAKAQIKKVDIKVCEVCGQDMDASHREKVIFNVENKIKDLQRQLDENDGKLIKVSSLAAECENKAKEIGDLKNKIAFAKNSNDKSEELNRIKSQIDTLEQNSEEEVDEKELSNLLAKRDDLSKNYDDLSKKIDVIKKSIAYLGDDGLKAYVINKYIPIINERINYYLEQMNQFIQFEIDSSFNETIKSRYRDNFAYDSFSEGEKLRIDLAILLSWIYIAKKRNSISTNIMIFDEVLDGSMDANGIHDFLNIIKSLTDSNIFIISHKSEIIEGFDNILVAKKIGNFTELKQFDEI